MSIRDPAVATVGDVEEAGLTFAHEQVLTGEGPSCLLPPDQRVDGDTPCMPAAAEVSYSRGASVHGELEAPNAHGKSMCASDTAGKKNQMIRKCVR